MLPQAKPPSQPVERARESWIKRLFDLSRRNNLLYYQALRSGTLDLSHADPRWMHALLQGESVLLARLLPGPDATTAQSRALAISRRARTNLEEKGIETLFLGLGLASWSTSDDGRPPAAAVLLLPIAIGISGRERPAISLRRSGPPQLNPVLLHVLTATHGLAIAPEYLLEDIDEEHEPLEPATVYSRLLEIAREVDGFQIEPRSVLSNFSFQKLAMVRDLRERGAELAAHDVIAALAGDLQAHTRASTRPPAPDPRTLDHVSPDDDYLFLDADSSQQRVIAAILAGQSGVIHGPPGTGKSQTIANLIAACAAQGRRVLFVAEKRAALEVVLQRLDSNGLGHLALDLHGAEISRRALMQRFAESLALVRDTPLVDAAPVHGPFVERRARLNEHVARLHQPRAPSGMSVYALQGELLELAPELRANTRWRAAALMPLTAEQAARIRDLLAEASGFSSLFLGSDLSPWLRFSLQNSDDIALALDSARAIAGERLPALRRALETLAATTGLHIPATLAETLALAGLLRNVKQMLERYTPALYQQELDTLAETLAAAAKSRTTAVWAWFTSGSYRSAEQTVLGLRVGGMPGLMERGALGAAQLAIDVRTAAEQRRLWSARAAPGSLPSASEASESVISQVEALYTSLQSIARLFEPPNPAAPGQNSTLPAELGAMPLGQLERMFTELAADDVTPHRLLRMRMVEQEITARGAGTFITELRTRQSKPADWPALFEHAWLASCLDQARADDPALAGFHGTAHETFINEFCTLDRRRLSIAVARVRRAHAERVTATMNAHPVQAALVRREAEKKARHMTLRALLAQAPDVLTSLRPCWMASPLSVSQLIDAKQIFDLVIFDEASQVLPEDAIAAMLRGAAVVVAGDRNQLPPTTFFAAAENEEGQETGATEGFESLLDLMAGLFNPWTLDWHYRSRDESLIAFSNRYIYDSRLVTFPGHGGPPAVTHTLVGQHAPATQDTTPLTQEDTPESIAAEVHKVVELVIEHARNRPHETLGVITMGIRHAERIEAALDTALAAYPELEPFFDQQRDERFFVKNLERVQGDERDAIVLTIGYGKDRNGKLPYRFGPLLLQGGERRLNVAITRARQRMALVSSFDHIDMAPSRSNARGVELLRLYLEYAAGAALASSTSTPASVTQGLDPIEADIYNALSAQGLTLVRQWGASRSRLAFAVRHPYYEQRFVLAVECDGPAYRDLPTARDRDRLWRQQLEALGWRYHRIWSLDWETRRYEEIKRVLDAYEAAIAATEQRIQEEARGALPEPDPHQPATGATVRLGTVVQQRTIRPTVPTRGAIDQYSEAELIALIKWIGSDGRLRTDDEILTEMVSELGFSRRGPRIEAAVRAAIARAR